MKLPNSDTKSKMMQKEYQNICHTITKAEFNYMAEQLPSFGPTDIHKLLDKALRKNRTELYESPAQQTLMLEEGPRIAACPQGGPYSFKLTSDELQHRKCAFKPITPKYVMQYLKVAKPDISKEKTKKFADYEATKGNL